MRPEAGRRPLLIRHDEVWIAFFVGAAAAAIRCTGQPPFAPAGAPTEINLLAAKSIGQGLAKGVDCMPSAKAVVIDAYGAGFER